MQPERVAYPFNAKGSRRPSEKRWNSWKKRLTCFSRRQREYQYHLEAWAKSKQHTEEVGAAGDHWQAESIVLPANAGKSKCDGDYGLTLKTPGTCGMQSSPVDSRPGIDFLNYLLCNPVQASIPWTPVEVQTPWVPGAWTKSFGHLKKKTLSFETDVFERKETIQMYEKTTGKNQEVKTLDQKVEKQGWMIY